MCGLLCVLTFSRSILLKPRVGRVVGSEGCGAPRRPRRVVRLNWRRKKTRSEGPGITARAPGLASRVAQVLVFWFS